MKTKLSNVTLRGVNNKRGVNIPLRLGINIIGRQGGLLGDRFTSKEHCTIYVQRWKSSELVVLIDTSLNGTYINKSIIRRKTVFLDNDDTIGFGSVTPTFVLRPVPIVQLD